MGGDGRRSPLQRPLHLVSQEVALYVHYVSETAEKKWFLILNQMF